MIRGVLRDGVIYPVTPLPECWREGQELEVRETEPDDPWRDSDLESGDEELKSLCARIPQADHRRMAEALAKQRRDSKERVAREMGAI